MNIDSSEISGSIDILIQYKKGEINLTQASHTFALLTGLDVSIAEKFVRNLSRDNVISLQTQGSVH